MDELAITEPTTDEMVREMYATYTRLKPVVESVMAEVEQRGLTGLMGLIMSAKFGR